MNASYPIGETVFFKSIFENPQTNALVNPANVVMRLLDPNGVESRPAVTNISLGSFSSRFVPTIAGTWHVRWEATGTVQSVREYSFEVRTSPFAL